jgi:hypothetical protein
VLVWGYSSFLLLWCAFFKYEHDAQASGCMGVTHLLALRACMGLFVVPIIVVRFF